jgi:hypothetical protein
MLHFSFTKIGKLTAPRNVLCDVMFRGQDGSFKIDIQNEKSYLQRNSNAMKDSAMKRQTEQECTEMHCKNDKVT